MEFNICQLMLKAVARNLMGVRYLHYIKAPSYKLLVWRHHHNYVTELTWALLA